MIPAGWSRASKALRSSVPTGLLIGLLAPAPVGADAGHGELGGYRLGDRYPMNAATQRQETPDGSLKIIAQAPAKPPDIETVYVYVTPGDYTIGKIVLHRGFADLAAAEALATDYQVRLEALYGGWERLPAPVPMPKTGGAMLSRLRQGPYALIVFYRGTEQGAEMAAELEYASASPERQAWKAQLKPAKTAP